MSGREATLRYYGNSRAEGYRKAVRMLTEGALVAKAPHRARPRVVPERPSAINEASVNPRSADPILWDGINGAYQALVEKGFLVGLSEREQATKQGLARALERLVEPYDLARLEEIQTRRHDG